MKRAKLFHLVLVSTLLALTATGCKKNPKNITTIPNSGSRVGGTTGPGGQIPPTTPGGALPRDGTSGIPFSTAGDGRFGGPGDPMLNANEDRSTLAPQTIYFEFDRSAIKTDEQPKLDAVGSYIKNTPGVQLKIEGNCDERGTEEYNRALGERRALAAMEYLIQKHGIESSRITTVSFGEDKPVSLDRTEEGYAKNRRADFIILKP